MSKHTLAEVRNYSKIGEVNGSLIAAAPEMYEALKDLIQAHDVKMGKSAVELRIQLAKEILTKIEA